MRGLHQRCDLARVRSVGSVANLVGNDVLFLIGEIQREGAVNASGGKVPALTALWSWNHG